MNIRARPVLKGFEMKTPNRCASTLFLPRNLFTFTIWRKVNKSWQGSINFKRGTKHFSISKGKHMFSMLRFLTAFICLLCLVCLPSFSWEMENECKRKWRWNVWKFFILCAVPPFSYCGKAFDDSIQRKRTKLCDPYDDGNSKFTVCAWIYDNLLISKLALN